MSELNARDAFIGRVMDAGGGEVRIFWDRRQLVDYPPVGATVICHVIEPPLRWSFHTPSDGATQLLSNGVMVGHLYGGSNPTAIVAALNAAEEQAGE